MTLYADRPAKLIRQVLGDLLVLLLGWLAVRDELVNAGGCDGHAVLVVLDLAGDADLHSCAPWGEGPRPIGTRRHVRAGG